MNDVGFQPGPVTRPVGLETEFGLLCAPAGPSEATKSDLPDVERAAALIFRHRPVGYRSTNLFLPNGGRLYLDVGSHPEYASAECGSIDELLAQERAGELLFADLARTARKRLLAGSEGPPPAGQSPAPRAIPAAHGHAEVQRTARSWSDVERQRSRPLPRSEHSPATTYPHPSRPAYRSRTTSDRSRCARR